MKTQLLTISTLALLFIGQSAMAFEQINNENGYDSAYRNGWVSASTQSSLDAVSASYTNQPSSAEFEQVNNENGYDSAYRNGWVSAESLSSINLDLMKASFRSDVSEDMHGSFKDALSINYLTTK